jgi:anti-sigma factor RsiW
MNAAKVQEEELHAFVDGQLPKGRCTTVLAYLGQHPEEVVRLAAYARQKEELRARLEEVGLATGDLRTAELQQALAYRLAARSSPRDWLRRAAAMAVLLGAGWWSNTMYHQHLAGSLPDVVMEAAQAHEIFSGDRDRPVELTAVASTDLAAWFSSRLGELVQIPSLGGMGLRLVGGRLLAGDQGPVAQLIYEDASGYRMSLCLSSAPNDSGPELEVVNLEGLTAGYWHEGDLTYALVAKATEQQVVSIATELGADQPEHWL